MPITNLCDFGQIYFLHINVFPLNIKHKFQYTKFLYLETNSVTYLDNFLRKNDFVSKIIDIFVDRETKMFL